MIEIDLELPLASFALRVAARLEGGVTAVMGPSGSGKTSLLEAIAGLRRGTTGRIRLDGDTLLDSERGMALAPEARRVGYVPQDAGLFPHLTAHANVRFGARADAEAVQNAVRTLELGPLLERHPASLSGGEKQRVALARALATRPRLLLLREGRVEATGAPFDLLATPGMVKAAALGVENLFAGRVRAHDPEGGVTRVDLPAGQAIAVPLAPDCAPGMQVTVAVRAEDVIVSKGVPEGISARNIYEVRITALTRTGADVTLRCAPGEIGRTAAWIVRVTPAAVTSLGLDIGQTVFLAVKSHSVRLV